MPRTNDPELRGKLVIETAAAICMESTKGNKFWFPRSQIGYMRKDKSPDGSVALVMNVPEWLVESKDAWELVP